MSRGLDVRRLVRGAGIATLATSDRTTGCAYASLVEIATAADAAPVLLLSRLARHTQNLLSDARMSLLVDVRGTVGNPLAGPRATLIGRARIDASRCNRDRFLRRHEASSAFADYSDFNFWSIAIESAHLIGGFGRIHEVTGAAILLGAGLSTAQQHLLARLPEQEATFIAEATASIESMNGAGLHRITGLDLEGLDMIGPAGMQRLEFAQPAGSPAELEGLWQREFRVAMQQIAIDRGPS